MSINQIHANERAETRAARDKAPLWAFESRAQAEQFSAADETEGRR